LCIYFISISAKIIRFSVPFIYYCIVVAGGAVMFLELKKKYSARLAHAIWDLANYLPGGYRLSTEISSHTPKPNFWKIIFFASHSMLLIIAQASFFSFPRPFLLLFHHVSFYFTLFYPNFPGFPFFPVLHLYCIFLISVQPFSSDYISRYPSPVGGAYLPLHTYSPTPLLSTRKICVVISHSLLSRILGLSLSAALNAPIPDTKFGIFRM
jgi:hypothetical protein